MVASPSRPPRLPAVSGREMHALLRKRRQHAWLDVVLRHGTTFSCQGVIGTCDPRLVEPLLMRREHTEHRSRPHRFISRITPGSAGLLFMEGEPWRRHLRAVMPAFTRQHVHRFARFIAETTVSQAERWAAAGDLPDLFSALMELGCHHVLRIGYGLDPADPLVAALGRELIAYKQATMARGSRGRLDQFGYRAADALRIPAVFAGYLGLRRRVLRMRRLIRAIVRQRERNGYRGVDWIAGMRHEGLPLTELADGVNHLYGAFNAVDYVGTATLAELSRHPDWTARVRAELDDVLGERAFPTQDDLERLPILDGVIQEVLRLYPVAMAIFRQTGAPLEVDGVQIPPGSQLAILPYALHRHPDCWRDPDRFDPARWLPAAEPPRPFTYIPFLVGPRLCIGRQLAELELRVVVSIIVRHYDLELLTDDLDQTPYLVPRFRADLPVRIRARAHGA